MSLTPATPAGLQSGIPPLIALTMEAFMNMHLPERGFLLHPVIPAQGIVILFAPRGIGKTFTALSAALAVAGGATLFHWHAPNPKQVLYVDGEMPAQAMQDRLISLARGTDATEEAIRNLSIITPDMQKQRFKLQPEWRKPLFAVKRQENRHKKVLRKHSASFTTYNSWIFQDSAVSAPYWERSFPAS